eukprot:11589314-Ditylum_brightwellii.AAC.1
MDKYPRLQSLIIAKHPSKSRRRHKKRKSVTMVGTSNVASDAARATLTVSTTILEKDQLLREVIAAASPLQLTVIEKSPPKKKGGAGGEELKLVLVGSEVNLSSIPPPVELTQ